MRLCGLRGGAERMARVEDGIFASFMDYVAWRWVGSVLLEPQTATVFS